MRNVDNCAADGPPTDDGTGGVCASAAPRRGRRRKQVLAAAGLATILGAGAFTVTYELTGDARTAPSDLDAQAPRNAQVPAAATSSVAPPTADGPAVNALPATPTPTVTAKSFNQRLSEARTAASRAGTTIRNPLPPPNGGPMAAVDIVSVTDSGNVRTDGHSLRVVSARGDLSGQRELGWVADDGETVGDARCSQNFRLSNNVRAKEHPTLLVCWRTSATRSVYTVAVDVKGRPSKQTSVAALDKAWAKLG